MPSTGWIFSGNVASRLRGRIGSLRRHEPNGRDGETSMCNPDVSGKSLGRRVRVPARFVFFAVLMKPDKYKRSRCSGVFRPRPFVPCKCTVSSNVNVPGNWLSSFCCWIQNGGQIRKASWTFVCNNLWFCFNAHFWLFLLNMNIKLFKLASEFWRGKCHL